MRYKLFCLLAMLIGISASLAIAQPYGGKRLRCDKFKRDCKDLKKGYVIAKVLESKRMADMIAIDRIKKLATKAGKPEIAKKPLIDIYEKSDDASIKRIALIAASELLEAAGDYEQAAAVMGKFADIKDDDCCDKDRQCYKPDYCDQYRKDSSKKLVFKKCFINKGTIIVKVGGSRRCFCGPDCRCPMRMKDIRDGYYPADQLKRFSRYCPMVSIDPCPVMRRCYRNKMQDCKYGREKCDYRNRDWGKCDYRKWNRCDWKKDRCDWGKKIKFEKCFINKGTIVIKIAGNGRGFGCYPGKCPFKRMFQCPTMKRFGRYPMSGYRWQKNNCNWRKRSWSGCDMSRWGKGKCDWKCDRDWRKDRDERCEDDRCEDREGNRRWNRRDWRKSGKKRKSVKPEECPDGRCPQQENRNDDDDRPEPRIMLDFFQEDNNAMPEYIVLEMDRD